MYGVLGFLAEWDLIVLLENFTDYASDVLSLIIIIVGLFVMVIAAIFGIMNAVAQQQKAPWWKVVVGILVGGAMFFGGLGFVTALGEGGASTISDMANVSTIITQLPW